MSAYTRWAIKKKPEADPVPEKIEEDMYPKVAGEFATVRALLKGKSIARFGDGELKMMDGFGYIRQEPNPTLAEELKIVARGGVKRCLIGIPTMDPKGAKYQNWLRHRGRFCKYFNRNTGLHYYSSFITRPDSAPWLECQEYADLMTQLWSNKRHVLVVSEDTSKVLTAVERTNDVTHLSCPTHGAYKHINKYEKMIIKAKPDIALLSCGVTATCLAFRLAKAGIQAIDIGSVGGFLLRWQAGGEPPEDYAAERANRPEDLK